VAIVGTLVLAFVLGTISTVAIRGAARRRATMVDDVAARVPAPPGARVLSAWQPAAAADEAAATYCLDGDTGGAAAGFSSALEAAGWKVEAIKHDSRAGAVEVTARGAGYALRGVVQVGKRPDCDGGRGQVTLTVQAAPAA
jgi:hypothetical protein